MKSKKAQIAMEFMIIIGAVLFFVSIFFSAMQNNISDKMYQRESIMLKEIALTVRNEIDLATNSIDGYSRSFEIPEKAGNLDYKINVSLGTVYIRTLNGKHAMAFQIETVIGEINIPNNTIRKIRGEVYINP